MFILLFFTLTSLLKAHEVLPANAIQIVTPQIPPKTIQKTKGVLNFCGDICSKHSLATSKFTLHSHEV